MRLGSKEYRQFVGIARGSGRRGLLPAASRPRSKLHLARDV